MDIRFCVTGERRKALVMAVSELSGWDAVYMKAPTFAYTVNNYVIDKNGTLSFDERTATEDARTLLLGLSERGFISEDTTDLLNMDNSSGSAAAELPEDSSDSVDTLTVEVPLSGFTDTALLNLEQLVESKAELICKSIGTDVLPIERTEDRLLFPWFSARASSDQVAAYTQFVVALCEMAKTQKRVTAKAKPVDSEKYAFRCFLLRLGFIGSEFASARKLLLANLSGDGSFKSGKRDKGAQEVAQAADSEACDSDSSDSLPVENGATTADTGDVEVSLYE